MQYYLQIQLTDCYSSIIKNNRKINPILEPKMVNPILEPKNNKPKSKHNSKRKSNLNLKMNENTLVNEQRFNNNNNNKSLIVCINYALLDFYSRYYKKFDHL